MKEIEQLIALSHQWSSDKRFVIAGGGNTSWKDDKHLWVKASGHPLATIDENGFAVMDRSKLALMASKTYSSDPSEREAQVKEDLFAANLTRERRPSVETSLHNCMNYAYVLHLHPTLINGILCSANAESKSHELLPEALYVPYTDPGYTLFKKVNDAIVDWKEVNGKEPRIILLQNHGLFVAADTTSEVNSLMNSIMVRLDNAIPHLPIVDTPVPDSVTEVLPAIRMILSRLGGGLKTLQVTKNSIVDAFLANPDPVMRPFTPDGIVYCKSEYVVLEEEDLVAEAKTKTVTDVFFDAMKIAFIALGLGGVHPMEPEWVSFIDSWEVENYRRKVAASGAARGRVEGKTIIVTGAAQGFGEGIARELMKEGANIVVADLNAETGEKTVASFNALSRSNRAIFVKTNVADMDSLGNLIKTTVCNFGALDTFVSNAGVVRAGDLEAMTPKTWSS